MNQVIDLSSQQVRQGLVRASQGKLVESADGPTLFYRYWPAQVRGAARAVILFHHGHEHSGQGGRFYSLWAKDYPVPRTIIETHSANMHMIPANDAIERQLKFLRPGNPVHIRGFLVEFPIKKVFTGKVL